MAKTIARGERMDKVIAIRATQSDVAEVKLAALNMGMDVSCYIRYLLIREKVINPTGAQQNTGW